MIDIGLKFGAGGVPLVDIVQCHDYGQFLWHAGCLDVQDEDDYALWPRLMQVAVYQGWLTARCTWYKGNVRGYGT